MYEISVTYKNKTDQDVLLCSTKPSFDVTGGFILINGGGGQRLAVSVNSLFKMKITPPLPDRLPPLKYSVDIHYDTDTEDTEMLFSSSENRTGMIRRARSSWSAIRNSRARSTVVLPIPRAPQSRTCLAEPETSSADRHRPSKSLISSSRPARVASNSSRLIWDGLYVQRSDINLIQEDPFAYGQHSKLSV